MYFQLTFLFILLSFVDYTHAWELFSLPASDYFAGKKVCLSWQVFKNGYPYSTACIGGANFAANS